MPQLKCRSSWPGALNLWPLLTQLLHSNHRACLPVTLEPCLFHMLASPFVWCSESRVRFHTHKKKKNTELVCLHVHGTAYVYTLLEQHVYVHGYSAVGGAPCSFLLTLWWFSSASKPQLCSTWPSCRGVTAGTLTGVTEEKHRSKQSKKMPWHRADSTVISSTGQCFL